jgi:hypothetical protein
MSATIPVFSMRSSGFSHSFANNPESRANGNFSICPYAAASGGAIFSGINNNVGQPALSFFGANDNTGTLTYAPICFVSFKRSGTNTVALSATDPAFIFCNGAADWNTGTTILSMTGNGNVGINCTPLTKFHVKVTTDENFKIQGHDALTDGVTLVSGNDVANAYKSMEFAASQFDFVNGKVGIGCTPVGAALDVVNTIQCRSSDAQGVLSAGTLIGNLVFYGNDNSVGCQHAGAQISCYAENDWGPTDNGQGQLLFYTYDGTNLLQRAIITKAGLVGIGCTPAAGSTLAIGGTNAAVTIAFRDNPTVTDPYTYTPICSRVEFHSAGVVNVTLAAGSLAEGTLLYCTRDAASSYVIVNGHDLSGAHGGAVFIKTYDNGWQFFGN